MGESKQRQQQDPNYGNPRDGTLRGLIITHPTTINDTSASVDASKFNKQELRSSLLYWDRLSMPTSNLFSIFPIDSDFQFLIDAGVLSTPKIHLTGDWGELAQLPNLALINYERKQRGVWSLGTGNNATLVSGGHSTPNAGTSIKLYNTLPSPGPEVPLSEILEFRQKRRSELLALRTYIEELTAEIEGSSDSEGSLNQKLSELDKACANLTKICREWRFPTLLTNLKLSLNFSIYKSSGAAVAAWAGTGALMLPETARVISTGGAVLISMLELKADINFQKIRRPSSPFRYAYEVQKYLL